MMEAIKELHRVSHTLRLTVRELNLAVSRALNDTMKSVRAQIGGEVASESGVKLKLIKERIATLKATVTRLEGEVAMIVFHIPAILLGARQTRSGVATASGRVFKEAFIAPTRRGSLPYRVFKRKGRDRYPILDQGVPIDEIAREEVDDIEPKLEEMFLKNLNRHLRVISDK